MNTTKIQLSLSEDERLATIRLSGRSNPMVCGVLAVETGNDGARVVYLNSRIHRSSEIDYEGWRPSGAITTILTEVPDVA